MPGHCRSVAVHCGRFKARSRRPALARQVPLAGWQGVMCKGRVSHGPTQWVQAVYKPPFRLVLRFNFQIMAVPDPAEAAGARAKKSCGWATHPSGSVPTGPALGPGPWPRRRATRRTPGPSLAASILQPQAAGLHVHCPGLSMPRATAPLHAAASASASMLLPARAPRVDWHGEGCFVRRPPKPALASWPLQCSGLL